MKIARFSRGADISFGVLDLDGDPEDGGGAATVLGNAGADGGAGAGADGAVDAAGELVVLAGDPMYAGFETTGERVALAEVKVLAPVLPRSKIVGIGRNYADHAVERGAEVPEEPMMFLKPNTAVVGPGDAVVLPPGAGRVDHEVELAIVIGRILRNGTLAQARDAVFGYTIGQDISARELQDKDRQWGRAKGFDTFCPLGPFIETELDLSGARIQARVNGELRQDGVLGQMVHKVDELVAFASSVFTLLPGDVILSGTPAGVGPLADGDLLESSIEGIGVLRNPVRNA